MKFNTIDACLRRHRALASVARAAARQLVQTARARRRSERASVEWTHSSTSGGSESKPSGGSESKPTGSSREDIQRSKLD